MARYIVIGGGLIGLSLVIELAGKIISNDDIITLITPEDLHNPAGNDYNRGKVIAFSDLNYEFLVNLGLQLHPGQIKTIIMTEGENSCSVQATQVGLSCLGYCLSWQEIYAQLCAKVCHLDNVEILAAKVQNIQELYQRYADCKHIFLCDGGNIQLPQVRYVTHDYQQDMLICRGLSTNYTCATAYEFFTPYGVLAVLPDQGEMICMFALSSHHAQQCVDDPALLHEIIKKYTANRLSIDFSNDNIIRYPLRLQYVSHNPYPNITLLGNAAHTIHPVMAQGLNLGLKNLQLLIKIMQREKTGAYEKYKAISKINIIKTVKFTHYLALYSKYNVRLRHFNQIKKVFWAAFNKMTPLQKFLFSFLQY